MNIEKVYNLFFSPTDTTKHVVQFLSEQISPSVTKINLTPYKNVDKEVKFIQSDLVFIAVPSYAGRVPDTFRERFAKISADNALAVLVVTFGNRAQEDTLIELYDLAQKQGFKILAGAEIVTQHSMVPEFGKGRPDVNDKTEMIEFVQNIQRKIQEDELLVSQIPGNRPYKDVKIPPMAPDFIETSCIKCGKCALECPTNAIDEKTLKCHSEKCISCLRCVKICPMNCRYADKHRLEQLRIHLTPLCSERKNNKYYL